MQRIENLSEKSEPPINDHSSRSLSPVLVREQKRVLPPMTIHYKKTLHVNIYLIINLSLLNIS
jgi:hypothetical protein